MPESWTISSVRDALAAKKLSARELAADFFKRIDAQNPTLNAYLTLRPNALTPRPTKSTRSSRQTNPFLR